MNVARETLARLAPDERAVVEGMLRAEQCYRLPEPGLLLAERLAEARVEIEDLRRKR